ncbi:hypothetical protein ERS140239_02052 [Staphylococcus schweitzeri]|nr:hypothetical protein ERS140162_00442 [Staphylococcus schweitzeri]CDR62196.1 hypothetical protein ERS140239_02052 [Staphylococcus schweitzeri]
MLHYVSSFIINQVELSHYYTNEWIKGAATKNAY